MILPQPSFNPRRGRHVVPAALISVLVASLLLLVGSAVAQAGVLKLAVRKMESNDTASISNAGNIALRVSGARDAHSVSLYMDGRLRQRDRSWPWSFGRNGQVSVHPGHHRITVKARVHRRIQIRGRSVDIAHSSARKPRKTRLASSVPTTPTSLPTAESTAATTLWHGDYEAGDLSQWDLVQRVAADRITLVSDPVRQGRYAARFEVRPGDNIGDTSTRAEVGAYLGEREGDERYYRWYTYFDPAFPTEYPNSFITFTQWRAEDESASYGSFMVWGNQIEYRREGTRWSTPLTKGVWHKFVFHVKWSPDPNVGFVELWYDDKLVMPKVNVRTMGGSPGAAVSNYIKQGLYKSDDIPTGVLYQDGLVSGGTLAEVNESS